MLNVLLRAGTAFFLWQWLKRRWPGTAAFILVVGITTLAHAEYVGYVEISEDKQYLIAAILLKWTINITALIAYVWYLVRFTPKDKGAKSATLKSKMKSSELKTRDGNAVEPTPIADSPTNQQDDGFDFLRNKSKLESRADKLLKQKSE